MKFTFETTLFLAAAFLVQLSFQYQNCSLPNFNMKNLTAKYVPFWKLPVGTFEGQIPFAKGYSCQFFFSFCKSMKMSIKSDNKTCRNVGGCLRCTTFDKKGVSTLRLFSLGKYNTSSITSDIEGILVKYNNGDFPYRNGSCKLRTVLQLACSDGSPWIATRGYSNVAPPVQSVNFNGQDCSLEISVPYAGACEKSAGKGSSSTSKTNHGLSPGSIMLIIFFVGVLIYLVGGMSYNFTRGALGPELIPHFEFWRNFPGYVWDGAVFFFRFVTCQSNLKDSYDNI